MEESSEKSFIIDTSALISLEIIEILKKLLNFNKFIISEGVLLELEDFAQYEDFLGSKAKKILELKSSLTIENVQIKEKIKNLQNTDNELVSLAIKKQLPIITDDIKIMRHAKNVQTFFSAYFLIALITSKALTKDEAIEKLNKIRNSRNWRDNIIYLTTLEQIQKL